MDRQSLAASSLASATQVHAHPLWNDVYGSDEIEYAYLDTEHSNSKGREMQYEPDTGKTRI